MKYLFAFLILLTPATSQASVVEFFFGWNPQLQSQRLAQNHELRMSRSQQTHAQKMARYGQPPATYYAPSYGYRPVYAAPPVVRYYQPSPVVRYYRPAPATAVRFYYIPR